MSNAAMTLEGKTVLKESWLTLYKGKKPGIFSHKQVPDKEQGRGWAVLHQFSPKGPFISFFQDNRKVNKILKKDKIELNSVREVTKVIDHPKHPFSFTLKCKNQKRLLLHCDKELDVTTWLKVLCDVLQVEYKREKVIWEYYDGGLWNALSDNDSFRIEAHYSENDNSFHLGDAQLAFHYTLNNMTRSHPRTRVSHRIKRTVFIEDRPEVIHGKMMDLSAFWEWGNIEKDLWHPFERDTNIQIEDMYDSGSQWAELTLCLPSPMPFLLDLHDMKLVNFRTAARYGLRRIDNSANMTEVLTCPEPRSPSPEDFDDEPNPHLLSPISPIFKAMQDCLNHLQISRKNLNHKQMLGEGAFGDVFLADAKDLPGYEGKTIEVAVKQLRLSDFIARHGHHSQQMEDFLREAKEMSKVDHHRVVQILAVCTLDYPLLLIEEYMDQGDLLGVLKDARPFMPLVMQLDIAHQVADGMDYLATGLNCVHRDLAARNILVSEDKDKNLKAKIADFGLSRHLYSDMYKHQGSKPRPLPAKWMALECLMYFIFTSKSDVWSYGVLIWEIMSLGRAPYPGVENRELLEQLEEKGLKLTRPSPCPGTIYQMVLDCTQHDPEERPTFAQLREQMEELMKQAKEGTLVSDVRTSVVSSSTLHEETPPQTTSVTKQDVNTVSSLAVSEDGVVSTSDATVSITFDEANTEGIPVTTHSQRRPVVSPARLKSSSPPAISPKPTVSPKPYSVQEAKKTVNPEGQCSTEFTKASNGLSKSKVNQGGEESQGTCQSETVQSPKSAIPAKLSQSLPAKDVAEAFNSQDEDLQERTGPFGHLYYLLDAADNHDHFSPTPTSNPKPPLPVHLPRTSPAHKVNSTASSSGHAVKKPFYKPSQAQSVSAGANGSHSDSSSAMSC